MTGVPRPQALDAIKARALRFIERNPDCTVAQVSEGIELPEGAARNAVNRLFEWGYLESNHDVEPFTVRAKGA